MIRAGLKMCPHGGGQDRGIAVDDQTVERLSLPSWATSRAVKPARRMLVV